MFRREVENVLGPSGSLPKSIFGLILGNGGQPEITVRARAIPAVFVALLRRALPRRRVLRGCLVARLFPFFFSTLLILFLDRMLVRGIRQQKVRLIGVPASGGGTQKFLFLKSTKNKQTEGRMSLSGLCF